MQDKVISEARTSFAQLFSVYELEMKSSRQQGKTHVRFFEKIRT